MLGKIMEGAAYTALSGKTYAEETEPVPFDSSITHSTTDFQVKKKSAIWDQKRESFYIRQGTLQGVSENIHDALDDPYHK